MGIFGHDLFSNDSALDFMDSLMPSANQVSEIWKTLERLDKFLERRQSGLAPRPQSEAERDEGIRILIEGLLNNNPHMPQATLQAMAQDWRASLPHGEPIMVDNGEEEISKASAAIAVTYSVASRDHRFVPKPMRSMLSFDAPSDLIRAANDALVKILSLGEVLEIFGTKYCANLKSLANKMQVLVPRSDGST